MHRDKRFQTSITTFFSPEDFDSDDRPARSEHKTQQSGFPSVPGTVQSSLLSVGMRVRKSVPEGYKTHKTAALPSIHTALSSSHRTAGTTGEAYSVKPPREPAPNALQHQRELLPFCGLHKIGGYAEQPVSGDAMPVNMFPLPAQAFNEPFSSQSSTESVLAPPANPHKRHYHDDDPNPQAMGSDFLFVFPNVAEDEVPVSPLSETPRNLTPAQAALRPFAHPKTRRPQLGRPIEMDGAAFKDADLDMDLENTEQVEGRVPSNACDFDEAPFLQPWSSPGREVEMAGL